MTTVYMTAVRTILTIVAASVAATMLGAGAAAAEPRTYEVVKTWSYSFVDGDLTLLPPIQDDVVEATCRDRDKMKDYEVNDPARVYGAWPRTDGTGIAIKPALRDEPFDLTITVTCRNR